MCLTSHSHGPVECHHGEATWRLSHRLRDVHGMLKLNFFGQLLPRDIAVQYMKLGKNRHHGDDANVVSLGP